MPDRRAPSSPSDASRIPQSAVERVLKRAFALIVLLAFVLYFGVGAIAVVLRYVVVPHIDTFRPRIEALASRALGTPVHIRALGARWQSLSPEFSVTGLTIEGRDGQANLSIDHAQAVVAWQSLLRFEPILASLRIDGGNLVVARHTDGTLSVAGVTLGKRGGNRYGFSNWLLAQRAIVVRGLSVQWRDELRGAPPMTLRDVRLAMLNRGRLHRAGLQARFDDAALGTIDLRTQFHHGWLGGLLSGHHVSRGDPHGWYGDLYLATGSVDLPTIGHYIDLPIAANDGALHLRSWLHFARGQVTGIDGDMNAQHLALQIKPTLPALVIPRVAFRFGAHQQEGDYVASVRQLSMEIAHQSTLPDGTPVDRLLDSDRFDADYRAPRVGRGERISLSGDVLDIGLLADFSRTLPLPLRLKRNIDRYDPRGVLADYHMQWERQAPATDAAASAARVQGDVPLQRYQVHAQLEGVSLAAQAPKPGVNAAGHPHIGQPGFQNLHGSIDADQSGGHLALNSHDASVTVRGMFDEPTLAFETLVGNADWHIDNSSGTPTIDASFGPFQLANGDVAGQVQGRFRSPLKTAPFGRLDISAQLDRANVPAVPRYLPTSIGATLRGYLSHAFVAGDSHHVRIEAHGRLPDLPFPHGPDTPDQPHQPSVFTVDAPFEHGRIDLSPFPAVKLSNGQQEQWPAFAGVNGRFFVDGKKLGFDVTAGHYRRVQLTGLTGRIDDLSNPALPLAINGRAAGPLADMVQFVNDSPLGFWSHRATAQLHADGPAALSIHLDVPRHKTKPALQAAATPANAPHTSKIPVSGGLTFLGNRLAIGQLPSLDGLRGRVDFTDHSAASSGLHGRLLGGDVAASGNMRGDGGADFQIEGIASPHNLVTAAGSGTAMSAAPAASAATSASASAHSDHTDPLSPTALAVLERLTGSTRYTAKFHRVGHGAPDFALKSDLVGLQIALPAPIGKAAATPMPLSVNWRTLPTSSSAPAPLQRIDLMVGPARASYLRQSGNDSQTAQGTSAASGTGGTAGSQSAQVVAGSIGIGGQPPMPRRGVVAAATLETFDADAWRAAVASILQQAGKHPSTPAAAPLTAITPAVPTSAPAPVPHSALLAYTPERFDIDIGELTLLSRHWNHVAITGNRTTTRGWQAQLDSQQVNGAIEWQPQAGSAIHARFSKLDVPAADPALAKQAAATAKAGASTDGGPTGRASSPIRHYPAIDLVADRFSVSGREFGKLELLAHNLESGGEPIWEIDHLNMLTPAASLFASGNWSTSARSRDAANPEFHTALDFNLEIANAGDMLTRLGVPNTVKGGKGSLRGSLHWQGSPGNIDTHTLDGKLAVDLHKGQILKVNPGAARLLGIINLQGLARFLQFDFKGIFGKGLAFDHLSGDSQIANGIATTHDLELHTSPANVVITGTANIPDQQQDLLVTVEPNINAVSASLAATAVNPLLGLGTLVAQLALSEPISRSLTRRYAITGSWKAPHVERTQRTDANRGKMPE